MNLRFLAAPTKHRALVYISSIFLLLSVAACQRTDPNAAANSARQAALDSLTATAGYIKIQPGSFWMGDEEDGEETKEHYELRMRPRHRVELTKAFELSKYEITQAQWTAVMGVNPSNFQGATLPVENISWNEVQEFIKRLQPLDDKYIYRLPSEAEWEYACRAGSTGIFSGLEWEEEEAEEKEAEEKEREKRLGKSEREREREHEKEREREREREREKERKEEKTRREPKREGLSEMEREARKDTPTFYKDLLPQAWFRVNTQRQTHPVGQLKPNAWGLYDMHGNVAEFCQDWYDFNYYKNSPPQDPTGPAGGIQRINRGGSWQMPASYCRAAVRLFGDPNERQPIIGFRLARSPK